MQINYQEQRIIKYHWGRRLQRLMNVMHYLEWAIMINDPVDAYAMTSLSSFWYKCFLFTPEGVLHLNTTAEHLATASWARAVIQASQHKQYPLRQTTLETVLHNWQRHGVWNTRPLSVPLLWAWAGARGVPPHIVHDSHTPATSYPGRVLKQGGHGM
jgi:hypothetical protein